MAHGDFVYWRGLRDVVDKLPAECEYKEPTEALAQVFSLNILHTHYTSLPPPYNLTNVQAKLLKDAYDAAISNLATKHMAAIIDALGFTEYEMDSALAQADRTPYEALLEGARKSEMNNMQHLFPMFVETRSIWKNIGKGKL